MHRYTKGVKTMTIKQVNTGAHGRKPRYFIENEGGGTVAHFDSLCTAALVLRYLNGAPMTEEEALIQIDLLGHDFYVYFDQDTHQIQVIYHRKNGGYGIIKPVVKA